MPPAAPEPLDKDVIKKGKQEKEKAPEKDKKVSKTPSSARATPSAPPPAPVAPQPPAVPSWQLRIYSVGGVRLAPDTRREDEIAMIKSAWEAVDKGRAKSAKGLRAQRRQEMKEVPFDASLQVSNTGHGVLLSDDVLATVCRLYCLTP